MADLKITQLAEETSPVGADLIAIVDDVAGTPTTKKATLTNVATLIGTLAGGVNIFTSTHASPPASPSAGDLWLPTDSFYIYRYSGSLWVPWGPIFPMTPPVSGDFSWVNQGSSSVTTTNGGIYLVGPPSASVSMRARVKTAPATPYTITAGFMSALGFSQRIGIGFRNAGDGKMSTLEVLNGNTYTASNWNSETSFNGALVGATAAAVPTVVWLRIQDDGTNRIYSISVDGQNFVVFYTIGRTNFMTADQVLFMVHDTSNLYTPNMTLLSWKET